MEPPAWGVLVSQAEKPVDAVEARGCRVRLAGQVLQEPSLMSDGSAEALNLSPRIGQLRAQSGCLLAADIRRQRESRRLPIQQLLPACIHPCAPSPLLRLSRRRSLLDCVASVNPETFPYREKVMDVSRPRAARTVAVTTLLPCSSSVPSSQSNEGRDVVDRPTPQRLLFLRLARGPRC